MTAKIQVGFRRLLQNINDEIENATLLAESEEKYPSVDLLEETVNKVAKMPALDYQRNPFVSSPHFNLPSERRKSSLFPHLSPTKRLLEINDALTISPVKRQKL